MEDSMAGHDMGAKLGKGNPKRSLVGIGGICGLRKHASLL
jgi:hypothetical protein